MSGRVAFCPALARISSYTQCYRRSRPGRGCFMQQRGQGSRRGWRGFKFLKTLGSAKFRDAQGPCLTHPGQGQEDASGGMVGGLPGRGFRQGSVSVGDPATTGLSRGLRHDRPRRNGGFGLLPDSSRSLPGTSHALCWSSPPPSVCKLIAASPCLYPADSIAQDT